MYSFIAIYILACIHTWTCTVSLPWPIDMRERITRNSDSEIMTNNYLDSLLMTIEHV